MDVQVNWGTDAAAFAGRLLSAARELDLDVGVVKFSPDGHFTVPEEVAERAGVSYDASDETGQPVEEAQEPVSEPDSDPADQEPGGEPDGSQEPASEPESDDAIVVPQKDEPGYLAGKGLEEALKERGLPSKGTADEKRYAVAAYDAASKE